MKNTTNENFRITDRILFAADLLLKFSNMTENMIEL